MSSDKKQSSGSAQSDASGGLLHQSFKVSIQAAEDFQRQAFNIPLDILKGMGAPEDKIEMLRDKSQSLIGELYSAINSAASQFNPSADSSASDKDG